MKRRIDLMIVGAHKAGSTSLFRYLSEHSKIHTPHRSEMSFFLYDHEYEKGYEKAFTKYFGTFPSGCKILVAKLATAMYSKEAIERLKEHNPDIHIAVVLRNPVSRAYSAYWFARRKGTEDAATFEEGLAREEGRLKEGWLKWTTNAYVFNSTYYPHIERLYKIFGRERVHVFLTEELHKNPMQVCGSLLEGFDLGEGFTPDVGKRHNTAGMARSQIAARFYAWLIQPKNPVMAVLRASVPGFIANRLTSAFLKLNEKEFTPPPINPETKKRLIALFRPHNDRLAAILGRSLENWNG